ncbi:hypothetical protein EVAR_95203_1 [Eumeta japonica]|uniref:Uncharacterized protein n=1 Tax=Eumeta variegata TaxID=151549 RepID=A0A4C1VGN3_EUMVA|nr:hypothetical protein EVAR_95203_1 [Eumeta japonica]
MMEGVSEEWITGTLTSCTKSNSLSCYFTSAFYESVDQIESRIGTKIESGWGSKTSMVTGSESVWSRDESETRIEIDIERYKNNGLNSMSTLTLTMWVSCVREWAEQWLHSKNGS